MCVCARGRGGGEGDARSFLVEDVGVVQRLVGWPKGKTAERTRKKGTYARKRVHEGEARQRGGTGKGDAIRGKGAAFARLGSRYTR